MRETDIAWVPRIRVGHHTCLGAMTGCTVVVCESGMVAGVDVRGSARGTRETDILRPMNTVTEAHAVLLTGGSAFGLDAASGVMRYLGERRIGFKAGDHVVPIVPEAVLFDLWVGDGAIRLGVESGYSACLDANVAGVVEGNVGAGTGATVGKLFGRELAAKGGLGA